LRGDKDRKRESEREREKERKREREKERKREREKERKIEREKERDFFVQTSTNERSGECPLALPFFAVQRLRELD
jgi:hypothetical protein